MTGELKDKMCGRKNCEMCELLNQLFVESKIKSEISLLIKSYDKYARLYNH